MVSRFIAVLKSKLAEMRATIPFVGIIIYIRHLSNVVKNEISMEEIRYNE